MTAAHTLLQVLPAMVTGGVPRGTVEIAQAMQAAGYRPLVASAGGPNETVLQHMGVTHLTLPLQSKNPVKIFQNATRLQRLIQQQQVDLIHARSRAPAWSALMAARRCNIPFVTTFHGVYGLKEPLKKTYNSVMVRGDRVIAVSDYVAEHLLTHYHIDPERIRIIHRGADLCVFNPERVNHERLDQLRQDWQINHVQCPILLLPGRLTRLKGQILCIKALAELPTKDYLCLLVGNAKLHPAYVQELEQLIEYYGLINNIRIVPDTNDMTEAYALSYCVLNPKLTAEAFGRVSVEAQAMGKPVIATRLGGVCETIIDGQTGWLVPPADEQALVDTIYQVLTLDSEQYQRMARQAIANAQNFSLTQMQDKTLAVYRELLG